MLTHIAVRPGALEAPQLPSSFQDINLPTRENLSDPLDELDEYRQTLRAGARIVIVDDSPEWAKELALSLRSRMGINVLHFSDSQTAAAVIGRHASRINLLLLDMDMPGMSGPDLLRHLSQHDALIPFVIISGQQGEQELVGLLQDMARAKTTLELASLLHGVKEFRSRGAPLLAIDKIQVAEYPDLVVNAIDAALFSGPLDLSETALLFHALPPKNLPFTVSESMRPISQARHYLATRLSDVALAFIHDLAETLPRLKAALTNTETIIPENLKSIQESLAMTGARFPFAEEWGFHSVLNNSFDQDHALEFHQHSLLGSKGLQGVFTSLSLVERLVEHNASGSFPEVSDIIDSYRKRTMNNVSVFRSLVLSMFALNVREQTAPIVVEDLLKDLLPEFSQSSFATVLVNGHAKLRDGDNALKNIFRGCFNNSCKATSDLEKCIITVDLRMATAAILSQEQISSSCFAPTDPIAAISWEDNGPGFPAPLLEAWARGQPIKRPNGEVSTGLSLLRRTAREQLGGIVEIGNTNHGARVQIYLPT